MSDDQEFLKKVRNARLLGVENDSEKRYSNRRSWDFDVNQQGWRYHMSNLMAAIGIEQLKRFTILANKRRKLSIQYNQQLSNLTDITLINHNYDQVVPHIFVVRFTSALLRNHISKNLNEHGIQTGLHYKPSHLLSLYRSNSHLKNVEQAYSQLLSLPLHPDLEASDVDFICDLIQKNINAV